MSINGYKEITMGVMGLTQIMDRSIDIIRKYIKTISLLL
jgi:hypothetical protein